MRIGRDVAIGVDPGGFDPTVPHIAVDVGRQIGRGDRTGHAHHDRDSRRIIANARRDAPPVQASQTASIDGGLRQRRLEKAVEIVLPLLIKAEQGQAEEQGGAGRSESGAAGSSRSGTGALVSGDPLTGLRSRNRLCRNAAVCGPGRIRRCWSTAAEHLCGQAAQRRQIVDIVPDRQSIASRPISRAALEGLRQHLRGAPGDRLEQPAMRLLQADQVIAAILGRAEDEPIAGSRKRLRGLDEDRSRQGRAIRVDQAN